jgi:hypothetical protein
MDVVLNRNGVFVSQQNSKEQVADLIFKENEEPPFMVFLAWGNKIELDAEMLTIGCTLIRSASEIQEQKIKFPPFALCQSKEGIIIIPPDEKFKDMDDEILLASVIENIRKSGIENYSCFGFMTHRANGKWYKFAIQKSNGHTYHGVLKYSIKGLFKKKVDLGELISENIGRPIFD